MLVLGSAVLEAPLILSGSQLATRMRDDIHSMISVQCINVSMRTTITMGGCMTDDDADVLIDRHGTDKRGALPAETTATTASCSTTRGYQPTGLPRM
eukprot:3941417-Rhodomonas_salina.1